jgi:hypothetical protein
MIPQAALCQWYAASLFSLIALTALAVAVVAAADDDGVAALARAT